MHLYDNPLGGERLVITPDTENYTRYLDAEGNAWVIWHSVEVPSRVSAVFLNDVEVDVDSLPDYIKFDTEVP